MTYDYFKELDTRVGRLSLTLRQHRAPIWAVFSVMHSLGLGLEKVSELGDIEDYEFLHELA
jgi:hypothetical protein